MTDFVYDISVPIRESMPVYPGDPTVTLERVFSMDEGEEANLTRLDFGLHTGTHVDAPLHVMADGTDTESLPLAALIGPCVVADATDVVESIGRDDVLRHVPPGTERVLFKTSNSELWRRPTYSDGSVSLSEEAAGALVELGVLLIGVDYLSVGNLEVHRRLLGSGTVCVEGLDLREVSAGPYELICLPMRILGSDGAPARAVLRPERPV